MKSSKTEDKKSRKPYEPLKLFNLGGSVAYARIVDADQEEVRPLVKVLKVQRHQQRDV